jgi:hypothetical protein
MWHEISVYASTQAYVGRCILDVDIGALLEAGAYSILFVAL